MAMVSKFMNLRFIAAFFSTCELLSSKTVYTLGSRSKAISLRYFEARIYHHMDREILSHRRHQLLFSKKISEVKD